MPSMHGSTASKSGGDVHIHPDSRLRMGLRFQRDINPNSRSLKGTYPSEIPDWNNLNVIHRNTLPPRSSFTLYRTEEDALRSSSSSSSSSSPLSKLLSGEWKFHFSKSPLEGPRDFYSRSWKSLADWASVQVPGMWQCQGYGKGPQYTNVNFPFPVCPPCVPSDENECGRYARNFRVGTDEGVDRYHLRFEGVDSSFSCWLNGDYIGYSQGSRNPSEFDVTEHIKVGHENMLFVEVYQRCDGSYIEDQVCSLLYMPGLVRGLASHASYRTNGG